MSISECLQVDPSVSLHFLGENLGFEGLRVKDLEQISFNFLKLKIILVPKFPSLAVFMIICCVQIRLTEDDHPDIRVEIDFTGFGARNSETHSMNRLQEWEESLRVEIQVGHQ